MGLDRFANFILKSINTEGIEKLNIENNIRKIITNHVIFDLNFLIYQEITEIENEINDLFKIILSYKNSNNINILYNLINEIINKPYWKLYEPLTLLLKDIEKDNLLDEIIVILFKKISYNELNNIKVIDLMIYNKILNTIKYYVDNLHYTCFIKTINIFYDGIPSLSKIIEQRRRRIKNYLEFNEKKKIFKLYFDKLLPSDKKLIDCLTNKYKSFLNVNDIITFNYLEWIKNRFSIDKSIGPACSFIQNLEYYIKNNINYYFTNIKININSAYENGESDLKIFKFIANNNLTGDYCIHTTDSDLIHQMLVQQSYYKILNKDINISVIKYIKNINLSGYVLILDGNIIIKNILDLYNINNNVKTYNYKIIWDICLIFYFFGNDYIPSLLDIGPELGLDYYLKIHYQSLNKTNIVNINNDIININLNNLLLYLEKINEMNQLNITKIILQRFFKINYLLIILLIEKFKLNFNEILLFLENFIIFRTLQMSQIDITNINENDLRKILLIKHNNEIDKYKDIKILNLDELQLKLLNESIELIENNINYLEHEYMGLIIYNKNQVITTDPYQDLYNYISEKTTSNLIKLYPIYYDHINFNQHLNILNNKNFNNNDFLKKIYHLVTSQFGNMKDYHINNITYYKYYNAPSLNDIINFLYETIATISIDNLINKWDIEINKENIKYDYFNFINHHLLISPFIINYNLSPYIKNIINELNLDNLWITDINTFNYRDIDVLLYFLQYKNILNKYNQINFIPLFNDIYNIN